MIQKSPKIKENPKQTKMFVKTAKGIERIGKCPVCGMTVLSPNGKPLVCQECGGKATIVDYQDKFYARHRDEVGNFYAYNRYKGMAMINNNSIPERRNEWNYP